MLVQNPSLRYTVYRQGYGPDCRSRTETGCPKAYASVSKNDYAESFGKWGRPMYFMLDNYDSFVYNLSAYFRELGQEILVKRENEITLSEIEALRPEGILLSPGPGKPSDAAASLQILHTFKEQVPILGVCLGHQAIGHYFGAHVEKGTCPMHGKITEITHRGRGLFKGLPRELQVTRYHSLVVSSQGFPKDLTVEAWSAEGVIMGISHRCLPIYGVQFHPEAVLTQYGMELLNNFHKICREWRADHADDKDA